MIRTPSSWLAEPGSEAGRRRGTFLPLAHRNAGYEIDGKPNEIARVNRALFERKCVDCDEHADGLSTVAFQILDRRPIADAPDTDRHAPCERLLVRPLLAPDPAQLEACAR